MPCEDTNCIYVILVNGNISKDGWFDYTELAEARRVSKKYEKHYTVEIKRIIAYVKDLT
jgi:hypothetical protein